AGAVSDSLSRGSDEGVIARRRHLRSPMPRARFDLIIADIDGCLTPEGPEPFDVARLAQIAAHNERAFSGDAGTPPPITLCSGRPQPFAEAMCRLIHNTRIPCVCENGVWVYHP